MLFRKAVEMQPNVSAKWKARMTSSAKHDRKWRLGLRSLPTLPCARLPDPAPLAYLLLSLTTPPSCTDSHATNMALEEAIDILNILTPIAKAVPILGAPVEGSLEALSPILEFAQARHLPADLESLSYLTYDLNDAVYEEENGGACR
jgi:hypothetical protein